MHAAPREAAQLDDVSTPPDESHMTRLSPSQEGLVFVASQLAVPHEAPLLVEPQTRPRAEQF
jgi:hypothetical protein